MDALIKKRAELDDKKLRYHLNSKRIGLWNDQTKYDAAIRMYGLSGTFSATQLKNAYKRMALIYHPDKPGGTKESSIIEVGLY
jgi:hypothetical protein